MQRYEYRSLVVSDPAALSAPETVAELNRLGGEGWHVATAVPEQRHGYVHEVHVLLVRPQVPGAGASADR